MKSSFAQTTNWFAAAAAALLAASEALPEYESLLKGLAGVAAALAGIRLRAAVERGKEK